MKPFIAKSLDEANKYFEFCAEDTSISHLTIQLNLSDLSSPQYVQLLQKLKGYPLQILNLVFPKEEIKHPDELAQSLLNTTLANIHYPVAVYQENLTHNVALYPFYDAVIEKIHHPNGFIPKEDELNAPSNPVDSDWVDHSTKTIPLKGLMKQKEPSAMFDHLILVEERFEIIEQHEEVQEVEEIFEVQVQTQAQVQAQSTFDGDLIDFAKFRRPPYSNLIPDEHLYKVFEQELFGNLPKGIKYTSPEAADVLAKNAGAYVTLNADNLPEGFILKKTSMGELVLDYSEDLIEDHVGNVFTPKPAYSVSPDLIYDYHQLPQSMVKELKSIGIEDTSKCHNLWIKYGDEGVKLLVNTLKECEENSPGLNFFIQKNYLKRFPQWDIFLDDKDALTAFLMMSTYNPLKLECLKEFWPHEEDGTHFKLTDVLAGYEKFWKEWEILAQKNNIDQAEILASWEKPEAGHPVVYMERLMTILKNARSLPDQLILQEKIQFSLYHANLRTPKESWDLEKKPSLIKQGQKYYVYGYQASRKDWDFTELPFQLVEKENIKFPDYKDFGWRFFKEQVLLTSKDSRLFQQIKRLKAHSREDKISLTNYGAYYASKYEDFKIVTKDMKFLYDPNKQNEWPFNPESSIYRVSLTELIEDAKIFNDPKREDRPARLENGERIKRIYRYVGQSDQGIDARYFIFALGQYLNYDENSFYSYSGKIAVATLSLFFFLNERYEGKIEPKRFLGDLDRLTGQDVVYKTIALMESLTRKGTDLSDMEGFALLDRIALMNSNEFENLNFDKDYYIKKIFDQLFTNKQATLKCIRKVAETKKWPFVYALDTAEFLSKDTTIQIYYRDSLLLFTTLLNSELKECYHAGRNDPEVLHQLEEIKAFLLAAATTKEPNNYQYAYLRMIDTNNFFTYKNCIAVYHELQSLTDFDASQVDSILIKHSFKLHLSAPKVFSRDNHDIKVTLIILLMSLERYQEGKGLSFSPPVDIPQERINEIQTQIQQLSNDENDVSKERLETLQTQLNALLEQRENANVWYAEFEAHLKKDLSTLQAELNVQWQKIGTLLTYTGKAILKPIFSQLLDGVFNQELEKLPRTEFSEKLMLKISQMPIFKNIEDFESLDNLSNHVSKITELLEKILSRKNFTQQESRLTKIITDADFNHYEYDTLFELFNMLYQMQEREYSGILSEFFKVSADFSAKERSDLLKLITDMSNKGFPSSYIEKVIRLYPKSNYNAVQVFYLQIVDKFRQDPHDPILTYLFETPSLNFSHLENISRLTDKIQTPRFAIAELLKKIDNKQLDQCLETLLDCSPKILQIMAMSYSFTTHSVREKTPVNIKKLAENLKHLSDDNLNQLYELFEQSIVNLPCLSLSISDFIHSQSSKTFEALQTALEKKPFGERSLDQQFSITEVERVVNGFIDMNNRSMYPYQYRKQLMESFLFINRAGRDLPIYNNKPAIELSNQELRDLFKAVKDKKPANLDDFQRRLYALGLLREIMYRTTGQFPYSTQILAIIDCMMHEGDVMQNIDTGQGKSLTDMLKASLLWLESDRVDLITSSLVDAKRDLEFYNIYLNFLDIPHCTSPISTSSPPEDFKRNGLNVSTLAQFSLVDSKAQSEGIQLDSPNDVVSLVLNESDDAILDNRIIYRSASVDSSSALTEKQEWVYDAINEFVKSPRFMVANTTEKQDIDMLRQYLLNEAKENKKSSRFIRNKISDAQLLEWIESAIIVNYRLRENFDYVVSETPIVKKIRGVFRETFAVKILQKDGKVSSDTQYGKGMEQLLYSKLNKASGEKRFILEPESKTLISSNNKNRIDYYRSRKGYIWGSSGTVGFGTDIDLQYRKFGFDFSRVAPHQAKQVKENDPQFMQNEPEQFAAILEKIKNNITENPKRPNFLFLKDIETVIRFSDYLKSNPDYKEHFYYQLFQGLEQEETVIAKAAKPGMLTITTQALGRNTDVKYPEDGMNLIDTFVSPERNRIQRVGRTGRQGSKGQIDSIYNLQDFKGKTIAEQQETIEEAAEKERKYNEDLFDIIGYLLSHVNHFQNDRAFFKNHWSSFSQSIEKKYHTEKLNQTYNRNRFIEEAVNAFNQLPIQPVRLEDLKLKLAEHYKERPNYASYEKEVRLKDCLPTEWIAYHFLNPDVASDSLGTYTKEGVKLKLKKLFDAIHKKDFHTLNIEYLKYLNAEPQSRALIKEAHQDFLKDYLKKQVAFSKNTSWIRCWLGFEGHLSRITQDSQYLMMFKAMVDVRQEKTAFVEVKSALKTLLEEYSQYNWFVNGDRKKAISELLENIDNTKNFKEIINVLMASKIDMMQQDIIQNQSSWRRVKPLHWSGHSRFHTTLDRAIKLASTMGQEKIEAQHIDDMFKQLQSTGSNTSDEKTIQQTIDELKKVVNRLNPKDHANVIVITKSIEFALENNQLQQKINSMTGRKEPKKG